MTVDLGDYREELVKAAPELEETLDGLFHESARLMSSAGLKDYLDGARALISLGKGPNLLVSYLDEMPQVVKECGEDVIRDVVGATLKLSSMVSGEILTLMISTLPGAARRFGDADLLRDYLQLLQPSRRPCAARSASDVRRAGGIAFEADPVRPAPLGRFRRRSLSPRLAQAGGLFRSGERGLAGRAETGAPRHALHRFPAPAELLSEGLLGARFLSAPERCRPFRVPPVHRGRRPASSPTRSIDWATSAGLDLYRAMCAHMAAHITSSDKGTEPTGAQPGADLLCRHAGRCPGRAIAPSGSSPVCATCSNL